MRRARKLFAVALGGGVWNDPAHSLHSYIRYNLALLQDDSPDSIVTHTGPAVEKAEATYVPGDHVRLKGGHALAGQTGTYIGQEKTPYGMKPKVRLDVGSKEVFVADPNWMEHHPL